jgi:hypothetical protein
MEDISGIQKKQEYLRSRVRKNPYLNKRLNINLHNCYVSFVECLLSRGDRKVSRIIFNAWKKGAKFDAWGDSFVFERWAQAAGEAVINPHFYVTRRYAKDEIMPWDFIDTGISRDRLWSELNTAEA